MKCVLAGIVLLLIVQLQGSASAQVFTGLADTSAPLVVRQEKALNALSLWRFMSPEFAEQFSPGDEAGITRVSDALKNLAETTSGSTESISSPAQHYLIYVLLKVQSLNGLDFSDAALQKFYGLNPTKYPCEEKARVSEFVIPTAYLEKTTSPTLLAEISKRLKTEQFSKVAYDVTSRYTTPGTGYLGDVTSATAGRLKFSIYQQAVIDAGMDKPAGPYNVEGGVIYVQVDQLLDSPAECYGYYKDHVVQDYGRVWLQKIYTDTLTTLTSQLKPKVAELTTGTKQSDIAIEISGHTVSLSEARQTLPFLMGNEQTLEFWKSIQRQALEVELFYHSAQGQQLRESEDFEQWVKILAAIRNAGETVEKLSLQEITSATLERFYRDNGERYASIGAVSFTLYRCGDATSEELASCAGELERLAGVMGGSKDLPSGITSSTVGNVLWNRLSREAQVATQSLAPGEWSAVFTENGIPQVIHLKSMERKQPGLEEVADWVKHDLIMEMRQRFWMDFAGIEGPLGAEQ